MSALFALLASGVAGAGLAVAGLRPLERRFPGTASLVPPCLAVFLLALPLLPALPAWSPFSQGSHSLVLLSPDAPAWPLQLLAAAAWLTASALLALRLLRRLLRVNQLSREPFSLPLRDPRILDIARSCANELGLRDALRLRWLPNDLSPFVAGVLKQTVYLPLTAQNWPSEKCRMILLHELSHVRRRDPAAKLLLEALLVVHWCNPFVWILRRSFLAASEDACDRRVLAAGFPAVRYAGCLIDLASEKPEASALHAALGSRSNLSSRIRRILNHPAHNFAGIRRPQQVLAILLFLALVSVTLACREWLDPGESISPPSPSLRQAELVLRLSADPFPGNSSP
ncbi:MAG TPA: M56 family metallopeptidase [Verrucomicrobiales bacterium]|nr:M56 family metallopeptidase [Verrucomicrobiales bacterium]